MTMFRFPIFFLLLINLLLLAMPAQADITIAMKAIERGHYATAERALRKPAANGDMLAQNNLGYLYEHGLGVEQSYSEALSWYSRAAEAGLGYAQYNLATLYHYGRGASKNQSAALVWYTAAANSKLPEAQYMMGEYQREGWGGKKDAALALSWYLKAAKQGHPGAQLMASTIYLSGEGWRSEPDKALIWAELARINGERQAVMVVAQAGKKIRNKDLLAEAMQLASVCLQSEYKNCPE